MIVLHNLLISIFLISDINEYYVKNIIIGVYHCKIVSLGPVALWK